MSEQEPASPRQERTLDALWAFASAFSEVGRSFARAHGMHTSDAAAVIEILTAEERGQPLTPARLSERISLTAGATSILLNRLEEAGHIVRERGGHNDRRLVTLHSTPKVHQMAEAYYAPMNAQLHAILGGYSDADLALVEDLAGRLRAGMDEHLAP